MQRKLTFIFAALLTTSCGSTPRPPELIAADELIGNATEAERVSAAAPELFKESQAMHAKANEAFDDGDLDESAQWANLASIKFNTGLEVAKTLDAEGQEKAANDRAKKAEAQAAKEEKRRTSQQAWVDRLEKILALQNKLESKESELAKKNKQSAAEKRKLAAELENAKKESEKAKVESEKALAVEKEAAEVKSQLTAVSGKIDTASSLDAAKADASELAGAKDTLAQAERALTEKNFEMAKKLVATADKAVSAILQKAQGALAQQKQKLDILAEREALLKASAQIGASAKREERGVVVTLYDMFDKNETEITPEREQLLKKLAVVAHKYPDYPIVVEGYTDARGRKADNITLSSSRAETVASFLVQQEKIDVNRVKAAGFGPARPVADNSTREGRAKNRRIEVVFLFQ